MTDFTEAVDLAHDEAYQHGRTIERLNVARSALARILERAQQHGEREARHGGHTSECELLAERAMFKQSEQGEGK